MQLHINLNPPIFVGGLTRSVAVFVWRLLLKPCFGLPHSGGAQSPTGDGPADLSSGLKCRGTENELLLLTERQVPTERLGCAERLVPTEHLLLTMPLHSP